MHEPMSERHYVFSYSPYIIYRFYIDTKNGKDPCLEKCLHDHCKLQYECDDYPPTDNENDPTTST